MSRRKQPQSFPSGYYLAVSHHPLRLVTQPTTSSFGAAFRNRGHAAAPPTPRMWRAYQALLQHSTQLQLHSRRASRLSHEAVVSRTARKLASLRLPFCFLRNGATPSSPSSATQHVTYSPLHLHGSRIGLPHSAPWPTGRHTQKAPDTDAMRPNLHAESGSKPDEFPRDAKLEAGYIRCIRMLPTEGPEGEICFETCIRRSRIDDDSHENRAPENFSYVAISYSWGDPTPLHPVIVDGQRRLVATNL